MQYLIRLGIPEVEQYWENLTKLVKDNKANKKDIITYNKLGKTFKLIAFNPLYPGLKTHEIDQLTKRYGYKVFDSYVENNKPGAMRVFWVYGPNKNEITIIGIEPHPNDKSNSYKMITLSATGD